MTPQDIKDKAELENIVRDLANCPHEAYFDSDDSVGYCVLCDGCFGCKSHCPYLRAKKFVKENL